MRHILLYCKIFKIRSLPVPVQNAVLTTRRLIMFDRCFDLSNLLYSTGSSVRKSRTSAVVLEAMSVAQETALVVDVTLDLAAQKSEAVKSAELAASVKAVGV